MREYIPQRLQELLSQGHINVSGLASKVGISHTGLRKLKMGAVPSANTLVSIADTIGKPLDYFFEQKRNYSVDPDLGEVS